MTERTDVLARMRVASPCSASWEGMEGDARVRLCRLCDLNVYNISELTSAEVEALVVKTEGRLCGRLTRRADGTVLTRDCPVGLRAVRRRASRAAGAAFAALLGLFAVASGKPQQKQKKSCPADGDFKVERTTNANSFATVSGVVTDSMCGVVPNAEVTLTNRDTGRKYAARASDEGEFLFAAVTPGPYTFEVNAQGFRRFVRDDLQVGAGESARVGATLDVGMLMGEIVITNRESKPDIESHDGITVFRGRALTDLPIPH